MKYKFWEFIRDESGQTSTEYILLVAVVAMIIMKLKKNLGDQLSGLTDNAFKKVNDELNNSQ